MDSPAGETAKQLAEHAHACEQLSKEAANKFVAHIHDVLFQIQRPTWLKAS
jgi:hypothetical protein